MRSGTALQSYHHPNWIYIAAEYTLVAIPVLFAFYRKPFIASISIIDVLPHGVELVERICRISVFPQIFLPVAIKELTKPKGVLVLNGTAMSYNSVVCSRLPCSVLILTDNNPLGLRAV